MNETTEKCSQARYARTILKVTIFLIKSDTVKNSICVSFDIEERSESNENANAFIMSIFDFDVIQ